MPLTQWNLEFVNHNAVRRYPLIDSATGVDATGSFTIPTDFLVGLDLPIHAAIDTDPDKFFIRQIGAFATGYSLTVAYVGDAGYIDVATAIIPAAQHSRNTSYMLGGIAPYEDTAGKIVVGRLDTISLQPSGLWEFAPEATWLEPDAIRPIIRGVQALIVTNGSQRSQPIYGDVELVAGQNMRITPILVAGQNPQIRFDAVSGENLNATCVCAGDNEDSPCFKKINGVIPTAGGEFHLVGDQCLEIVPITNGLQIRDKCSQPCCGCAELEAITRDLERFNSERVTLTAMVGQLLVAEQQLELTVLGSRLGDRGCVTC